MSALSVIACACVVARISGIHRLQGKSQEFISQQQKEDDTTLNLTMEFSNNDYDPDNNNLDDELSTTENSVSTVNSTISSSNISIHSSMPNLTHSTEHSIESYIYNNTNYNLPHIHITNMVPVSIEITDTSTTCSPISTTHSTDTTNTTDGCYNDNYWNVFHSEDLSF